MIKYIITFLLLAYNMASASTIFEITYRDFPSEYIVLEPNLILPDLDPVATYTSPGYDSGRNGIELAITKIYESKFNYSLKELNNYNYSDLKGDITLELNKSETLMDYDGNPIVIIKKVEKVPNDKKNRYQKY